MKTHLALCDAYEKKTTADRKLMYAQHEIIANNLLI
jgi:hypothetical protein